MAAGLLSSPENSPPPEGDNGAPAASDAADATPQAQNPRAPGDQENGDGQPGAAQWPGAAGATGNDPTEPVSSTAKIKLPSLVRPGATRAPLQAAEVPANLF